MNGGLLHFGGISGSLRKGSFNTMLLKEAAKLLPEEVTMEIISFADLPLYNADFDLPAAKERPEPVKHFRDIIAKFDALVIASPEYNYGLPGGLKNAIDWASRGKDSPLMKKPVAIMGTSISMSGTVRMQTAFLSLYLYLDMKPVYKPEILIAEAEKKFDKRGNLQDAKARVLIKNKLAALKELCIQLSEVGSR